MGYEKESLEESNSKLEAEKKSMGEELENTKKQLQECEESKKELQETLQSAISNQETTESKYKILASEIQKIEEDLETVKKELSL